MFYFQVRGDHMSTDPGELFSMQCMILRAFTHFNWLRYDFLRWNFREIYFGTNCNSYEKPCRVYGRQLLQLLLFCICSVWGCYSVKHSLKVLISSLKLRLSHKQTILDMATSPKSLSIHRYHLLRGRQVSRHRRPRSIEHANTWTPCVVSSLIQYGVAALRVKVWVLEPVPICTRTYLSLVWG